MALEAKTPWLEARLIYIKAAALFNVSLSYFLFQIVALYREFINGTELVLVLTSVKSHE